MGFLKKSIMVSLAFTAAILLLGYSALTSSSYIDVSQLPGLKERALVTVRGYPGFIGYGNYTLEIGEKRYSLEARGSYGIARAGTGESYVVFVLESRGYRVMAVAPLAVAGASPQGSPSSGEVVVSGVYDPGLKARILRGHTILAEYGVLSADKVLKGCHSSYSSGAARIGE